MAKVARKGVRERKVPMVVEGGTAEQADSSQPRCFAVICWEKFGTRFCSFFVSFSTLLLFKCGWFVRLYFR